MKVGSNELKIARKYSYPDFSFNTCIHLYITKLL